jgi:hypothetical protein
MHKRYLRLILPLFLFLVCLKAHAACGTITSGMSTSQLQTAISSCSSGQTAQFPAGTWSITSQISIPCGVSISGPVVSTTPFPGNFTASLNGSVGANWGFHFPGSSCTAAMSVQYLNWNGGQPSNGGGGFLYVPPGSSNITVQHNHIYGNQSAQSTASSGIVQSEFIYLDGSAADGLVQTNITIEYNYFGSTAHTDCSNIMQLFEYYGSHYDTANAGQCGAVGVHESNTNVTISYNKIEFQEEPMKFYEGGGTGAQKNPCVGTTQYCQTNLNVTYNDISYWHRCGIESQGTPNPTANFNYNSIHDPYYGQYGTWFMSTPAYYAAVGGPYPTNIASNIEYNLMLANVACVGSGCYYPGEEFWSTGSFAYNLVQNSGCGPHYGNGNVPWNISYNILQNAAICNEGEGGYPSPPAQVGNTVTSTISAVTSVAPTVSPSGGTVSSGQVISITNSGTNLDANTSAWCTTDGSTPVPGSGTATIMTSYTVNSNVTLRCVGMWGSANQPTSYATNYGYVPSAVVTNTYTLSGPPTTATPTLSPASETFSLTPLSVMISDSTSGATIYYTTDGSTPTTSSTVYTGALSISATTTVKAIAQAAGYQQSAVGTATYTYSQLLPAGCYQGNATGANTIAVGATVNQIAFCYYTTPSVTYQCFPSADPYGNKVTSWLSLNPTIVGVNSTTGVVTGVAVGTGTIKAVAPTPSGYCSDWGWTVTPGTAGFAGSIGIGVIGP